MTNNQQRKIPAELRDRPQWVCWRRKDRNGKTTKVPISPNSGKNASVTNPDDWSTFDRAVKAAVVDGLDGVGFVFTADDPYVGIDVDHGKAASTEDRDWLKAWISRFATYVEKSQSGEGVHLIGRATLPDGAKNKYPLGKGGAAIELYQEGRYFVMTGEATTRNARAIADIAEPFDEFVRELQARTAIDTEAEPAAPDPSPALGDDEILDKARRAKNGGKFVKLFDSGQGDYPSESERDMALAAMLAFWTADAAQVERLMRRSTCAREKWDKHPSYLADTIQKAVAQRPPNVRSSQAARNTEEFEEMPIIDGVPMLPFRLTDEHHRLTNKYPLTNDQGYADRLIEMFGDRFIRRRESERDFFVWDKTRWLLDAHRTCMTWFVKFMLGYQTRLAEKLPPNVDEWRKKIDSRYSRSGYDNVIALAGRSARVQKAADELDKDPWFLNCLNGTLDLRNCALREHRREDYLTKLADVEYDPKAEDESWDRFICETFPDEELRQFVQMAFGTALTADYSNEVFYILQGPSGTGKSTLTDVILSILGNDYGTTAPDVTSLNPTSSAGGPRSDIARLEGKRMVTVPETEKQQKLQVSFLKRMSGGDTVTARPLYKEYREFRPTWKVFIATNYAIQFPDDLDDAIWRRLIVIPFDHKPEEPDPTLKERLRSHVRCRQAILAWLVEGCRIWQDRGRDITQMFPLAVERAIDEYRRTLNPLSGFFETRVARNPDAWVPSEELRLAYHAWAEREGVKPVSDTEWGRRLKSLGFEQKQKKVRGRNMKVRVGLELLE